MFVPGLQWRRVHCGYICATKYHFVTHELLEQGRGGYYKRWPWTVVDLKGKYKDTGPLPITWKDPFYRETLQQPHGREQYRWYDTTRDVPALREGQTLGPRPRASDSDERKVRNNVRRKGQHVRQIHTTQYPVMPQAIPGIRLDFSNEDGAPKLIFPSEPPPPVSPVSTDHDLRMAERQLNYESLDRADKIEQEAWAQQQLLLNISMNDRVGVYRRVKGGYYDGGKHLVTDQLLAEGLGGFYHCNYCPDTGYLHP
jgi:hypothetical protein